MIDLHEQADAVTDESTFTRFLAALAADREEAVSKEALSPPTLYGSGANGWENWTIEAFLEAASSWATDSIKGLPQYEVPSNPWKRCAHILLMGKLYE